MATHIDVSQLIDACGRAGTASFKQRGKMKKFEKFKKFKKKQQTVVVSCSAIALTK
jgi:hypothetical protein